jgi:predicted lysophospholipase L1 biosynthesis ABC-type transport system permease subunit
MLLGRFVWFLHLVVLLCLLLAGVELPLSVAVADLCMDPNT